MIYNILNSYWFLFDIWYDICTYIYIYTFSQLFYFSFVGDAVYLFPTGFLGKPHELRNIRTLRMLEGKPSGIAALVFSENDVILPANLILRTLGDDDKPWGSSKFPNFAQNPQQPLTKSLRHWLPGWLHDLSERLAEGCGREILNLRWFTLFFCLGTALKSDLYRFVGTYLPSRNFTWGIFDSYVIFFHGSGSCSKLCNPCFRDILGQCVDKLGYPPVKNGKLENPPTQWCFHMFSRFSRSRSSTVNPRG